MSVYTIASVVEGHGEVEALPILLRAIATAAEPTVALHVPKPIRIPKGKLLKPPELERAVRLAVLKLEGRAGGIFVLLDADDQCPAREAPKLLATAQTVAASLPVSVVFAKSEYES